MTAGREPHRSARASRFSARRGIQVDGGCPGRWHTPLMGFRRLFRNLLAPGIRGPLRCHSCGELLISREEFVLSTVLELCIAVAALTCVSAIASTTRSRRVVLTAEISHGMSQAARGAVGQNTETP